MCVLVQVVVYAGGGDAFAVVMQRTLVEGISDEPALLSHLT